ncbi:hypothetical protein DM194_14065 (plasmid) [Azospirillum ramasamyi]|uniref:Uncharacterized protein n=2 Tax=Azospirillum ramasamyi TaxID=682998 RepID=A0A2U9S7T2_9PROT|nr:hypothetical protein DM194_14065 [Azospirillum ramasamyi]
MVKASMRGVSVLEAEHVLANVWRRVEEYGVSAPHLHFDFRSDGSISLRFTFTDPVIAALVLNGLARVVWRRRRLEIRQGCAHRRSARVHSGAAVIRRLCGRLESPRWS